MSQSKLEKMYNKHADRMNLHTLDEMRLIISRFYQNLDKKSEKLSFLKLGDLIEFRFIKKMLYASDFKWPSVAGISGILVFSFHLLKDGVRDITIGSFHSDMIFMLLVFVCLFFSAYPFLIKSFNCNMQELPPASPYFYRLIKLSLIFTVTALFSVSVFYFSGLTEITFY